MTLLYYDPLFSARDWTTSRATARLRSIMARLEKWDRGTTVIDRVGTGHSRAAERGHSPITSTELLPSPPRAALIDSDTMVSAASYEVARWRPGRRRCG